MRVMFDAVNPQNIPIWAELVAGYIDGPSSRWHDAWWSAFPNSTMVRIATNPSTNDGIVLDVEQGDATPEQAPGWVLMRRAAGYDPTVYCNKSTLPAVKAAFAAQGVAEPWYWIAEYPGPGAVLYADEPRCVAHQWGGDEPGGYDESVVVDHWAGVDNAAGFPPFQDQPWVPAPDARTWGDGPFYGDADPNAWFGGPTGVADVQHRLVDLGFGCPTSGVFESGTLTAVHAYQQSRGLHGDNYVTARMRSGLDAANGWPPELPAPPPAPAPAPTPKDPPPVPPVKPPVPKPPRPAGPSLLERLVAFIKRLLRIK